MPTTPYEGLKMPASAIPKRVTLGYIRQGLGPTAIKRKLQEDHGVVVTVQAVSVFRRRQQLDALQASHKDLIPWTLAERHRAYYAAIMLRTESARRQGMEVPKNRLKQLERWKKKLADNGTVVHYDPKTDQGFWYLQARPQDTDLIRVPD